MLTLNETRIDQIVYDHVMQPHAIGPNAASYVGRFISSAVPRVTLQELAARRGRLTIRRGGGIGDLLFLAGVLRETGLPFDLQTAPHHVDLFDGVEFIRAMPIRNRKAHDISLQLACETAESEGWGREIPRVQVFARILGVPMTGSRPYLAASRRQMEEMAKLEAPRPWIVLQVRADSEVRTVSHVRMAEIARSLARQFGGTVCVVDPRRPARFEGPGVLDLQGALTVGQLVGLVALADLVVGLDSGVSVMGEALERPTVKMMGPTPTGARVGPDWRWTRVVRLEERIGCQPCWGGGTACGRMWTCMQPDAAFVDELTAVAWNHWRSMKGA